MKYEIYYNSEKGYTLDKSVNGVESEKRKPIKFKLNDSTSRFRKENLKRSILSSKK